MKDPYFHIESLIELIRDQEPERPDLIAQLHKSKTRKWIREPYIRFAYEDRALLPDSEWQIVESISLEHESEGTIVLDILKNGRIGGIEFVDQIQQ